MGCGCSEIIKQKANYENTKELAKRYAKSEGVIVFLYKTHEGYSFIDIEAPEAGSYTPIEYISPVQ